MPQRSANKSQTKANVTGMNRSRALYELKRTLNLKGVVCKVYMVLSISVAEMEFTTIQFNG